MENTEVWVTLAVGVGGRTETFSAEAKASTNGWRAAEGLVASLRLDAEEWLRKQRFEVER